MKRMPWVKWSFADWLRDPGLRVCSDAARGVWMDMLAHMDADAERGFLTVAGRAATDDEVARRLGKDRRSLRPILAELERNGVFSRDARGAIYNRRMIRDQEQSTRDRENGAKGGNPALRKATQAPLDGDSTAKHGRNTDETPPILAEETNQNNTLAENGVNPPVKAEEEEEKEKVQTPSGSRAAEAAPAASVVDLHPVVTAFWRSALPVIQELFPRYSEASCRRYLGRLLKESGDRHQAVLVALVEARTKGVVDPAAWLRQAIRPAGGAREVDDPITRRRADFAAKYGLQPKPPEHGGPVIDGVVG